MKKLTLSGDICRFLDDDAQKSFRANLTFDAKANTTTGNLDYPDRNDLLGLLNSALAKVQKKKLTTTKAQNKQNTDAAEIRAAVRALAKLTPPKAE